MSASFRELFVELPRALFETLHGIGEAAVAGATSVRSPRREPQLLTFLRNASARRLLAERYNWRGIDEPILADDENAVELVVWRACGHPSRVRIDGEVFAIDDGPREAFDVRTLVLLRREAALAVACACSAAVNSVP